MFIDIAHAAGVIEDAPKVSSVLSNIVSFLMSVVGVIAIIGLVIAGMLYFFAGGDRRQLDLAKNMTFAAVTGIIIALSALVIIKTLSSFFG